MKPKPRRKPVVYYLYYEHWFDLDHLHGEWNEHFRVFTDLATVREVRDQMLGKEGWRYRNVSPILRPVSRS